MPVSRLAAPDRRRSAFCLFDSGRRSCPPGSCHEYAKQGPEVSQIQEIPLSYFQNRCHHLLTSKHGKNFLAKIFGWRSAGYSFAPIGNFRVSENLNLTARISKKLRNAVCITGTSSDRPAHAGGTVNRSGRGISENGRTLRQPTGKSTPSRKARRIAPGRNNRQQTGSLQKC